MRLVRDHLHAGDGYLKFYLPAEPPPPPEAVAYWYTGYSMNEEVLRGMTFLLLRSSPRLSSFQVSWSDLMGMDLEVFMAMYEEQQDLVIKVEAESVGN